MRDAREDAVAQRGLGHDGLRVGADRLHEDDALRDGDGRGLERDGATRVRDEAEGGREERLVRVRELIE